MTNHSKVYNVKLSPLVKTGALQILCLFLILFFPSFSTIHAQEINFGEFSSKYGISITELNPSEDLSFGTLVQNEGTKEITLLNSKVIAIEGVKYLDVILEVIAEPYLYLNGDVNCSDPSCRIPFTLQAFIIGGRGRTRRLVLSG